MRKLRGGGVGGVARRKMTAWTDRRMTAAVFPKTSPPAPPGPTRIARELFQAERLRDRFSLYKHLVLCFAGVTRRKKKEIKKENSFQVDHEHVTPWGCNRMGIETGSGGH